MLGRGKYVCSQVSGQQPHRRLCPCHRGHSPSWSPDVCKFSGPGFGAGALRAGGSPTYGANLRGPKCSLGSFTLSDDVGYFPGFLLPSVDITEFLNFYINPGRLGVVLLVFGIFPNRGL